MDKNIANWIKSSNYDLKTSDGIELPDAHLETLESLNDLSIVTRYPEDIEAMIKSFKKNKVMTYLKKTKALIKWLKKDERLKKS